MKPFSLFYLLTVLLAVILTSGCNDREIGGGQVCTEIGCDDGFSVQLLEERPDSLSLTIYLNDDTEAFDTIICTNHESSCVLRAGGMTPKTVTVEIEWDSEEFRQTFTPEYESYQPNGPDCPPVCEIATIKINLSGL